MIDPFLPVPVALVGQTPLYQALAYGNAETVKALLDAGADPNAQSGDVSTHLHLATIVGWWE